PASSIRPQMKCEGGFSLCLTRIGELWQSREDRLNRTTAMARPFVYFVLGGLVLFGARADNTTEANAESEIMMEDAYASWLENFGDYIVMEEQVHDRENATTTLESPEESAILQDLLQEEQMGEDENEERDMITAPVALTFEKFGLLNPYLDYEVLVESQVEESGFVFVTLNPHRDTTRCGLGGLSSSHIFHQEVDEVAIEQDSGLQTVSCCFFILFCFVLCLSLLLLLLISLAWLLS
ncbi:uncharacterized protein LOC122245029, partial [Penaeus japonicus]|uniref:uncharacterized protein LOC122245029 n=1 Tax=Penaeus japonicus TaxID=27405 RepID=UPI001C716C25